MNKSVLIVEDEQIIAEDIRQTLKNDGYDLAITDTGSAALESVNAQKPSLVTMDIHLHGQLDGVETAKRIKRLCNIPIIFMTSNSDKLTRERAKNVSPWFLMKPFHEEEFLTMVALALK